jgi:hypothetical protein
MLATPSSHPDWARQNKSHTKQHAGRAGAFDDAAGSKSKCERVVAVAAAVELGPIKKSADVMHNNLCGVTGAKEKRIMIRGPCSCKRVITS